MIKPHVSNNSGKFEWYTPGWIIKRARAVMGSIDLDPASNEIANHIVKADRYITQWEDALNPNTVWGTTDNPVTVFLNPPYARGMVDKFATRLIGEITCKRVRKAIWLSNNSTETVWGQLLLNHAQLICFPYKRVKFLDMDFQPQKSPLQGQMILGLGSVNTVSFKNNFDDIGVCLKQIVMLSARPVMAKNEL